MQQSSTEGGAPLADTTRRLVLIRHAKARPSGQTDHERALAERGHLDAAALGEWFREQGIMAEAALVSDARRTRETWAVLSSGAAWDVTPDFSAALYAAGPDTALDLVRETSEDVGTLVVVGHNPTMAFLAEIIDDGEGEGEAITGLVSRGFPTSAAVVFDVGGSWAELAAGSGTVRHFHVGGA